MLNLGRLTARDCQSLTRRSLLQLGACSAMGLSLSDWLAAGGPSAQAPIKSVLLLWLWGGPSHHEMWDPKPNATSTNGRIVAVRSRPAVPYTLIGMRRTVGSMFKLSARRPLTTRPSSPPVSMMNVAGKVVHSFWYLED